MGIETIIAAIGLGLGAVGTAVTVVGQQKQAKAQKKAETLRENQMNLEASRTRRQQVREMLAARGAALTAGADQGAGEGSGIAGGLAQIAGTGGSAITATNQNQTIGQNIFAANRQYASGGSMASFGGGISSLGGALIKNSATISKLGTYMSGG